MTLEERLKNLAIKREGIIDEIDELLLKDTLTEDEEKQYTDLEDENKTLKRSIERIEAQIERRKDVDKPVNDPIKPDPGDNTAFKDVRLGADRAVEKRFTSLQEQIQAEENIGSLLGWLFKLFAR